MEVRIRESSTVSMAGDKRGGGDKKNRGEERWAREVRQDGCALLPRQMTPAPPGSAGAKLKHCVLITTIPGPQRRRIQTKRTTKSAGCPPDIPVSLLHFLNPSNDRAQSRHPHHDKKIFTPVNSASLKSSHAIAGTVSFRTGKGL